jgi:hypothetical protein
VECPQITGWQALYWDNPGLAGAPLVCQNVDELNLVWWDSRPTPSLPVDQFSARFSRQVDFEGGAYRFRIGGDDGYRLFVDGEPILAEWFEHPYLESIHEMELSAGRHTVVVEYFDGPGPAQVGLDWLKLEPDRGCLPPPDGLSAWWPGDGSPKNLVPGPNLEGIYRTETGFGWVGPAFIFNSEGWKQDQGGAYIVPLAPQYSNLENITVETWVYLDSGPHSQVERFISFSDLFVLRKDFDESLHFYRHPEGDEYYHLHGAKPPRGEWFHTAATYDGQIMRLYLNGQLAGELNSPFKPVPLQGLSLSSSTESLQGRLDEVTFYNRALNPDEIQAIFAAGQYGKCK